MFSEVLEYRGLDKGSSGFINLSSSGFIRRAGLWGLYC